MSNVIEEAGWKFYWRLTESAGIMVYLADYKGRRVLWEGSLPYITVDHQRETLDPNGDPGEPHGPWWVPLGTRTIQGPVRVQSFRGGVELSATATGTKSSISRSSRSSASITSTLCRSAKNAVRSSITEGPMPSISPRSCRASLPTWCAAVIALRKFRKLR